MRVTRAFIVFSLSAAMAAFTYGCGDDGEGGGGAGGTGGSGGAAGTGGGGTGGDGGTAGEGGMGGSAGEGGAGGEGGVGGEIVRNFETSLHRTRAGKEFWYRDTNGGFQSLVNVEYDELACQGCHNPADGSWAGEPTCGDCHEEGSDPPKHLQADTCLGCHGRQKAERGKLAAAGRPDVHTNSANPLLANACASCHGANDVHGNGTEYDTMLRPGAIAARCTDCHSGDNAPPSSTYHGGLHENVDCSLCHTETVLSCINCHFDTEVDLDDKCAVSQVFNWKFVMRWDKEGDGNPKYHPATIMTMKYDCDRPGDHPECTDEMADPLKTFAVFAPYYGHTVTAKATQDIADGGGCTYCHAGQGAGPAQDICAIIENAGGANPKQKLIEWTGTSLTNPPEMSGLIPLPEDFRDRFEIDYAEFSTGAGSACLTDGSPTPIQFAETGPDLWQTGADFDGSAAPLEELGRPLTLQEFRTFCPAP